jgi:hypothetical protein
MAEEQQAEEKAEQPTSSAAERAREKEDAWEEAKEKVKKMEEEGDPPSDLSEWPSDEAKYITYGGGEGDHGYDEGPEAQLGPSSLERHEDGSITIEGEEVDNPDDYKSDEPVEAAVQSIDDRKAEEEEGDDDDDADDDEKDDES